MAKVINLRGTYGSGKTTIARLVIDMYTEFTEHFIAGRKRPLYNTMVHPEGGPPLAVMGSYQTVCGGCDTIQDITVIFDTIDYLQSTGYDVLYESLLLTADVNRTAGWAAKWDLEIIYLDVPTRVCIDSVNMRRRAKDPTATDVNPKNLLSKIAGCVSSRRSLMERGVTCHLLDRASAFHKCLELLNITSPL